MPYFIWLSEHSSRRGHDLHFLLQSSGYSNTKTHFTFRRKPGLANISVCLAFLNVTNRI